MKYLVVVLALLPATAMAKDANFLPFPEDQPLPAYMWNSPDGLLPHSKPEEWKVMAGYQCYYYNGQRICCNSFGNVTNCF